MQADMVLEDLSHSSVNSTTNGSQEHQDGGAFISGGKGALDGRELTANSLDTEPEFLFLF